MEDRIVKMAFSSLEKLRATNFFKGHNLKIIDLRWKNFEPDQ